MQVIYPVVANNYTGFIKLVSITYAVGIHKLKYYQGGFLTYEAAFDHLKQVNIEKKLQIHNLIYYDEKKDICEVELTKGYRAKFDYADLKLVQSYRWSTSHNYARTVIDGKSVYLHNLIMNHIPGEITVDFINRDSMDNRRVNLRLADRFLQASNIKTPSHNTIGQIDVSYRKNRDSWRVRIVRKKELTYKSFSCCSYDSKEAAFENACMWREEYLKSIGE